MTPYPFRSGPKRSYAGFMTRVLNAFWQEENGQEMAEYTLLVAFFALVGAGVLTGPRMEIVTTWQAISASYAGAAS
jgi:Flp pilus assembly pilin Flp